ncbi:putative NADH dehydrogenase [Metarhizium anisopliae]|nr:putative NADH dehydrogenase [Metarhizium anisopliae]
MDGLTRIQCRSLMKLSSHVPRVAAHAISRRHASTLATTNAPSTKERVVILGSGWAGYAAARTLSPSKTTRILISPRSHFAFTPLLASTSVGTLEFRAAIEPVRRLGLDEFHQAWASSIDFKNKTIRVEANLRGDVSAATNRPEIKGEEFDVKYDKLVIAVGCYSQTFGIEGVKEHANFLRDVGDARAIRLQVLQAFETADLPTTSDEERKKLLHFAVVGGGPTGIEFAAELHDLIKDDLSRMYPKLQKHCAITVYDIAPKVLPMFDSKLAAYATETFKRQGIRVKTEHHLTRIRRQGHVLMLQIKEEPEEVGAGIVVWSTGLMQNPLVKTLVESDIEGVGKIAKDPRTGGIVTNPNLQVQLQGARDGSETTTLKDVYAVGDCTSVQGASYPATAQVAAQQAVYLAKQLNRGEGEASKPFKFKNWGVMTYLGSWRAIHQSEADNLRGWAAWVLWRTAYLTRSMSVRNKIMIPVYWVITWIFGRDISRF